MEEHLLSKPHVTLRSGRRRVSNVSVAGPLLQDKHGSLSIRGMPIDDPFFVLSLPAGKETLILKVEVLWLFGL